MPIFLFPNGTVELTNEKLATGVFLLDQDGNALTVGGSGGTSSTDDGAFTVGASSGTPVGGVFTSDSVDAGDFGVFKILANRQQVVTLADSSGVEITSFGGGTEYTDDTSTHATGTSKGGLMMAAATPTDSAVNANDIGAVAMTTDRKLHVAVMDALPAGTAAIGKLAANSGVDIGDVDVTSVPTDPFGANADAASATGSISAKLRFIAGTGIPITGTVTVGSHAVTEADGANVTLGAKADAKSTATDTTAITLMSVAKQISASAQVSATAAKQPALGTAGSASTDVITVQGIASMTPLLVTASAGTNLNTSLLALESGGNLATTATSLQLIDDIVYTDDTSTHATGTSKGALFMAAATPTDSAVNANDIGAVAMTTDRKLHVSVQDALPAGTAAIGKLAANTGVTIGAVEIAAAQTLSTVTTVSTVTALTTLTGGGIAHDGADSGNPIKIGGRARSSEIAAVANNDRSDLITDLVGKLIVLPYANPENYVSGAITSAMTGTTSTSLVGAPASGLRNYITQVTVSNAHATVGTDVILQDGSGGTTLYTIPAAAVYGGATVTFPVPLRQPTTATALYCANVTTGASTKVSASGYIGA